MTEVPKQLPTGVSKARAYTTDWQASFVKGAPVWHGMKKICGNMISFSTSLSYLAFLIYKKMKGQWFGKRPCSFAVWSFQLGLIR